MDRPPVTAQPWVIAFVIIGLLGIAFTLHWSAGKAGQLPAPVRSTAR